MSEATESITDAVTHLHNLLLTKEKELKEREADFDRRVKLYESTNPTMGSDNDILQLNVGGRTNIAVLRNLLTQFEGSMLAAKFSGRWDDSMEKDRDGNIFVDQDPDSFIILVDYLRMRMNNQLKQVPNKHRPVPTYKFCSMLEYYNLLPGVYPQTWIGGESFTCEEIAYGTVTLSSKEGETANALHPFVSMTTPEWLEFTVEFDQGASGAVGWICCTDKGKSSTWSQEFGAEMRSSMFLNIEERTVYGPTAVLEQNMRINHAESSTKVICRRSPVEGFVEAQMEYSFEVNDNTKVATKISSTLYPVIQFSGKVTVSGTKYNLDKLPTGSKNAYNYESQ